MTAESCAPGQVLLSGPMPRFGLPRYLRRHVEVAPDSPIGIFGAVAYPLILTPPLLGRLPRTVITHDFHGSGNLISVVW
ncbi:hypothetical protein GCM10008960_42450 [Deinococcus sedimenti]|uniref:Uncharacterized protein n=1 Tax=Deinococcus sedimenti TaxID=1867090 RepID=A0ABQ2S9R8_9DEIO|nr:hypothetical protein GCM10008960_42450 [Deinococcus sedimenti]